MAEPADLSRYRRRITIRDGTSILLRPITPADEELMLALFYAFSPQTRYQRWLHVKEHMPREELQQYLHHDFERQVGIVAVYEDWGEELPLGVGRFSVDGDFAEVAVVVRDDWQGRGVGTALLNFLEAIARQKGLRGFVAEVNEDNRPMLHVFQKMGFTIDACQQGVCRLRRTF